MTAVKTNETTNIDAQSLTIIDLSVLPHVFADGGLGFLDPFEPVAITSDDEFLLSEGQSYSVGEVIYTATTASDALVAWTLTGGDDLFVINDWGQVSFKMGITLDYETKSSYQFTVTSRLPNSTLTDNKIVTLKVGDIALIEDDINLKWPDTNSALNNTNYQGTSASDLLRGGAKDDTIFPLDGDDIIFGGFGVDDIHLTGGQNTIGYRFVSSDPSLAFDGADTVHDFKRGEDKLLLVDLNLDRPIASKTALIDWIKTTNNLTLYLDQTSGDFHQVVLVFDESGTATGAFSGADAGRSITINFTQGFAFSSLQSAFWPKQQTENRPKRPLRSVLMISLNWPMMKSN